MHTLDSTLSYYFLCSNILLGSWNAFRTWVLFLFFANISEKREKPFSRSERIRFSSLVTNAASPDTVKIICGICQKLLRRKSHLLGMGSTIPSGEQHAVAVLVCGHVYHADCLEQRTSAEDIRDPPCPLCLGSLTQVESSGVQE